MCVYIRQFCITAIIITFIENLSAIVIASVALFKLSPLESKAMHIIFLTSNIILNLLSFLGTYVFGLRMIYFKMIQYFRHYICFIFTFFFLFIASFTFNVLSGQELNLTEYGILKFILVILDGIMILTYGINAYLTHSYKDILKNQITDSLLNRASNPDSIDNEIYNNIIEQSLNPDDESLKDEYLKIKDRSAKKINHSSDL